MIVNLSNPGGGAAAHSSRDVKNFSANRGFTHLHEWRGATALRCWNLAVTVTPMRIGPSPLPFVSLASNKMPPCQDNCKSKESVILVGAYRLSARDTRINPAPSLGIGHLFFQTALPSVSIVAVRSAAAAGAQQWQTPPILVQLLALASVRRLPSRRTLSSR